MARPSEVRDEDNKKKVRTDEGSRKGTREHPLGIDWGLGRISFVLLVYHILGCCALPVSQLNTFKQAGSKLGPLSHLRALLLPRSFDATSSLSVTRGFCNSPLRRHLFTPHSRPSGPPLHSRPSSTSGERAMPESKTSTSMPMAASMPKPSSASIVTTTGLPNARELQRPMQRGPSPSTGRKRRRRSREVPVLYGFWRQLWRAEVQVSGSVRMRSRGGSS